MNSHIGLKHEVLIPLLFTGMIKPGQFTSFGVKTDQIIPFMRVALVTGQTQVVGVVRTTMF